MKINEVIQEGMWDKVKAGGKAVAGAGKALGQSVKDTGQMAQQLMPRTSSYVKSFGTAGNRLAKQAVGIDPNEPWIRGAAGTAAPAGAPSYASYGDDYKPSHEGEVFVVRARGQEYFKSFQDRWYQKVSSNPGDFSITHPLDDYKDYAALDKILQQGDYNIVSVKKSPSISTQYIATATRPAGQDETPSAGLVDQYGKPIQ